MVVVPAFVSVFCLEYHLIGCFGFSLVYPLSDGRQLFNCPKVRILNGVQYYFVPANFQHPFVACYLEIGTAPFLGKGIHIVGRQRQGEGSHIVFIRIVEISHHNVRRIPVAVCIVVDAAGGVNFIRTVGVGNEIYTG